MRGDTVSQIAARYRLNYRQIGALNGLDSQYTIYTGQYLKLWQGNENNYRNNNTNNSSQPIIADNNSPSVSPIYDVTTNAALGYEYPSSNQVVRNFDEQLSTYTGDATKEGIVAFAASKQNAILINFDEDSIEPIFGKKQAALILFSN